MLLLRAALLSVFVGVLVSGQDNCFPINPCRNDGTCTLKPNGDSFCQCVERNEGDFCEIPSTGLCTDPIRNFYGEKQGIVTSQDFPNVYPNSQNCPYFIGAADAKKIEITFHFLELQDLNDELAVGVGSVADFQKATYTFDKFVYNPVPEPIEMIGDRMWLNLYTDNNVQNRGFNISYRIDGDECLPNPCLQEETCIDLEYSYTCTNIEKGTCSSNACKNNGVCSVTQTGKPYCKCLEGFEGEYCQTVYNGICADASRNFYNQRSGVITSPNFPAVYPNNQDCAYFIGAPDAKKVEITFHSLGLQESRDNVTIGNGPAVDNSRSVYSYSLPSYSGPNATLPGPVNVIADRTWINLQTDTADQNTGFNISWRIDGDECLAKPCLLGETCTDLEFTYMCKSPVKLTCSPNPCQQKGVCDPKPDGTPYCQCTVDFQGDYCQTEIISSCNDRNRNFYGQRQGVITSPGFPNMYPNSQDCSYFVGVPDAKKVEITIHSLTLEGQDELTIGNGSLADYRENIFAYNEEVINRTVVPTGPFEITGDRAWLNLYTDAFNARNGFNISYRIDGDECLSNPCFLGEKCVDLAYNFACELIGVPVTTPVSTDPPAPVTDTPATTKTTTTTKAPAPKGDSSSSSSEESGESRVDGAALGGDNQGGDNQGGDNEEEEEEEEEDGGTVPTRRPRKYRRNNQRRNRNRRIRNRD